jgi:hypothetical protein
VNPSKDGGALRGSLGIPDWRTRHTEPIVESSPCSCLLVQPALIAYLLCRPVSIADSMGPRAELQVLCDGSALCYVPFPPLLATASRWSDSRHKSPHRSKDCRYLRALEARCDQPSVASTAPRLHAQSASSTSLRYPRPQHADPQALHPHQS